MRVISKYWLILVCCVLAALYLLHDESDSIAGLFGILWNDEGAYLLSAKNEALFGHAHLFAGDRWFPEYTAPLLYRYGLLTILPGNSIWLVHVGMGLQVLAAELLLARLAARYHGNWRAGAQCLLILMLTPLLFFYARIGLSEGMQFLIVALQLTALYELYTAKKTSVIMLLAAICAMLIAALLLSKITSVAVCVGLAIATLAALFTHPTLVCPWRVVMLSIAAGGVALTGLFGWWVGGHSVTWVSNNFGSVFQYYTPGSGGAFIHHLIEHFIGLPFFFTMMPLLMLGFIGLFMAADRSRGFLWLLWLATVVTMAIEATFGGDLRRSFFGISLMMTLAGFVVAEYAQGGVWPVRWTKSRVVAAGMVGLKVAGMVAFAFLVYVNDDIIYIILAVTSLVLLALALVVRGRQHAIAYEAVLILTCLSALVPILYQSVFAPRTIMDAAAQIEKVVPEDATITGITAGWMFQGLRRQIIFTNCVPESYDYANDPKTLPQDRHYFHMNSALLSTAVSECFPKDFEHYKEVLGVQIFLPMNKGAGYGQMRVWQLPFNLYEQPMKSVAAKKAKPPHGHQGIPHDQ